MRPTLQFINRVSMAPCGAAPLNLRAARFPATLKEASHCIAQARQFTTRVQATLDQFTISSGAWEQCKAPAVYPGLIKTLLLLEEVVYRMDRSQLIPTEMYGLQCLKQFLATRLRCSRQQTLLQTLGQIC